MLATSKGAEVSVASSLSSTPSVLRERLASVRIEPVFFEGVRVVKISSNGEVRGRTLTLSRDKLTIFITPKPLQQNEKDCVKMPPLPLLSRKGLFGIGAHDDRFVRAIDITSITHIHRGFIGTRKLELARAKSFHKASHQASLKQKHLLKKELLISIFHDGNKTLDLMMPSITSSMLLQDSIEQICAAYHASKFFALREEMFLRQAWNESPLSKDNVIKPKNLQKLLTSLNINVDSTQFATLYENFTKSLKADGDLSENGLTFDCCNMFLKDMKNCVDDPCRKIWRAIFRDNKDVSEEMFLNSFLVGVQGETSATIQDVRELFSNLNNITSVTEDQSRSFSSNIDKLRFSAFLLSDLNDAFDPEKARYGNCDMSQPLSNYWINSCHNTCTADNRCPSSASAETFIVGLHRGFRCLEINVWDGGRESDGVTPCPVVTHENSMTHAVSFRDVLIAIEGFISANPDTFPITLSFQNHCSLPYREVMAKQIIDILGDKLFYPPDCALTDTKLPSPESLIGMVVIKGRHGKSAIVEEDIAVSKLMPSKTPAPKCDLSELSSLPLLHETKLKTWKAHVPSSHIYTLNEDVVKTLCMSSKQRKALLKHNGCRMSQVSPGTKNFSCSFNPMLSWSKGCQMVYLDIESRDDNILINDGFFRQNGGCGYVLKPPAAELSRQSSNKKLMIKVICGSCLPKPDKASKSQVASPYVDVVVYDINVSGVEPTKQSRRTIAVSRNGFCPYFDDKEWAEFSVTNSTTAMVLFVVRDDIKDVYIASASIPFSCLRQGFRSIQLQDIYNTRCGTFDLASLLVEIKVQQ